MPVDGCITGLSFYIDSASGVWSFASVTTNTIRGVIAGSGGTPYYPYHVGTSMLLGTDSNQQNRGAQFQVGHREGTEIKLAPPNQASVLSGLRYNE